MKQPIHPQIRNRRIKVQQDKNKRLSEEVEVGIADSMNKLSLMDSLLDELSMEIDEPRFERLKREVKFGNILLSKFHLFDESPELITKHVADTMMDISEYMSIIQERKIW